MEAIQQARKLYIKIHHHQASLTDKDKQQLESDIQRFITISIKEVTAKNLFENEWMLLVLKTALHVRAHENSDVLPVAKAFGNLEKYFLLLVEQPWKPEFKEIKTYGGFYRTRIKAFLPNCEDIFKQAGYTMCSGFIMRYEGPVDKTRLLLLAFDCRVALVECNTIADHYNKVRGLSMTLSDAIANILHEENTREKTAPSYSLKSVNGPVIYNSSLNSSAIILPPALPKREPIRNGSNFNQMIYDPLKDPSHEKLEQQCREQQFKGMSYPPKSPHQPLYTTRVTKPPLTPSAVGHEGFAYIDAQSEEILPELPQGTCDEHMRESLKLVNLKDDPRQPVAANSGSGSYMREGVNKGEDWKWFRQMQENGDLPASNHTKIVHTYINSPTHVIIPPPINLRAAKHGQPANSIDHDEGIEQDLYPGVSKSFQNSAKYGYISGQPAISSNKGSPSLPPNSDNGYNTGPQNSQIYHAPAVTIDGANYQMQTFTNASRQRMMPPPIPSRALKPKTVPEEDILDGNYFRSAPSVPTPASTQSNSGIIVYGAPKSVPAVLPQTSNTEPILRSKKLAAGKSNSLKYPEEGNSLLQRISQNRTARSMDMTVGSHWQCQSCTTLNSASENICCSCCHSRQGPDVSHPAFSRAKKECKSCTFLNESDKTHCGVCAAKLQDYPYTYNT